MFFFLYSIGQVALETSLLICIAYLLEQYVSIFLFWAFIGFSFLFFILHILDGIMDRILNLSIWDTISFVSDETLDNFLYLLDASGISLWIWGVIFISLLSIPFIGIYLYKFTFLIVKKHPISLKIEPFFISSLALPLGLFLWDFSGYRIIHPNTYTAFLQSLPWKITFLTPKSITLETPHVLAPLPLENEVRTSLDRIQGSLNHKPNIYLFVIESLRKDILSEKTTPHLLSFFKDQSPIQTTLANGNGSHLSWFSIFHSQYSLYWNQIQTMNWKMGSPPLNILKNLGYKIHLYSSAQLGYYGMEKLLFGNENFLLNSYQTFHHAPPISAADTDANAILQLEKDLQTDPSLRTGNVFIIFWDSTHFDYSWPKEWPPKFTPFASELAYFKAFYSQNQIEKIKNRYRNAVYYLDSLFGQFVQSVALDDSIVVITGDHGEEFFDHGHLFHGSHLTEEQTSVPILMHFPKDHPPIQTSFISQMDIFPTMIDYLKVEIPSFIQGESIFKEKQKPFTVISRFNAGRTPYEFCIHNGNYKLIAQFINKDTFSSTQLQLRSIHTAHDENIPGPAKYIPHWIEQEFKPLFPFLFHE